MPPQSLEPHPPRGSPGVLSSPTGGDHARGKTTLPALGSPKTSFTGGHGELSPLSSPTGKIAAGNKGQNGGKNVSSFLKGLFANGKSGDSAVEGVEASRASSTQRSQASMTSRSSLMSSGSKGDLTPTKQPSSFTRPEGSNLSSSHLGSRPNSGHLTHLRPQAPPKPNTVLLAVAPVLPPNMSRPNWCMKDYSIVEKMYTGYASTVYKAWCKASGETVCLKAYNMGNLCELNRYQIYREVKLHSNLQHENIITLYAAFKEGDQVVLVQEFAESGDLFMLLHRYGGKLPEKTSVELVLHPFLCVLKYLHTNCIVHRDIKPENVLFTRSMQLKLCDFGLAIDLREERAVTRAGTLEYMAPEVLNCPFKNKPQENKEQTSLQYTLTVDTWAVGVLTYELLVGFPPFNDKQRAAIEHKIRADTPRFPSAMSELARQFVLKALQKDALERPTIMELLAHPWVRGHRRNASSRNLGASAAAAAVKAVDGGSDDPLADLVSRGGKGKAPAAEQRTDDGDLLMAPLPSYASFTNGANRPKFMQSTLPQKDVTAAKIGGGSSKKAGVGGGASALMRPEAAAMSFSTAQNPKLQQLRGLGYS